MFFLALFLAHLLVLSGFLFLVLPMLADRVVVGGFAGGVILTGVLFRFAPVAGAVADRDLAAALGGSKM